MPVHELPRLARRAAVLVPTVLSLVVAGAAVGTPGGTTAAPGQDTEAQRSSAAAKPRIVLQRTIRTSPFRGSGVSMNDHEGSAFVPRDNSLWLADDDGRRLYEMNARTGRLKRTIGAWALGRVQQFRGGNAAGGERTGDLESLAYDAKRDRLYAFSGSCCDPSVKPTVFRLTRQGKKLRLHSFQPLPEGSNNTASAWNPKDKRIYTGDNDSFRRYTYATNRFGPRIDIPRLNDVLGMGFSKKGKYLYVTNYDQKLYRVNWAKKRAPRKWTFSLRRFGIRDARGVDPIRGRLFVSDGWDQRSESSPLRHAVFVLDLKKRKKR